MFKFKIISAMSRPLPLQNIKNEEHILNLYIERVPLRIITKYLLDSRILKLLSKYFYN